MRPYQRGIVMAMTIVEKILARKSVKNVVKPDSIVQVSVDLAMIHDALGIHEE